VHVAVRIRLRRIGKKKQPQYRLVVAEAAGPRDGRFIESIGQYNPRVDPAAISVDEERALYWLQQGAQPSDTVRSLLVKVGVWEKFSGEPASSPPAARAAQAPAEAPAEEAAAEAEVPAADQTSEDESAAALDQPKEETEETAVGPAEETSG
jgi:small subunit ribosomal protein S16